MTSVRILAVLATVFFLAAMVQMFLAGFAVFSGGDLFADGNTRMEAHRMLGDSLALVAVLTLVAAAFTRRRRYVVVAAVALVLTGVTGSFARAGEDHPWAGGVHVLLAVAILGVVGWLAHRTSMAARKEAPAVAPTSA